MKTLEIALEEGRSLDWFLECINAMYQAVNLVSFNPMKEQMNLLGLDVRSVAEHAFYENGSVENPLSKMKRRLNEMFQRRNFISHQSDRDHADANRIMIQREDVERFMADGIKIVNAIDLEARKKDYS